MKRVKILHVAISRGWHAQVANAFLTLEQQSRIGYDLHLLTLEKSKIESYISSSNIKVSIDTIKHYNSPGLFPLLFKLFKKDRFDAIHVHGLNGMGAIFFVLTTMQVRVPVVCSVRDKLGIYAKLLRMNWKNLSKIIVPNEFVKQNIGLTFKNNTNVAVIPPPVDANRFKPGRKNGPDRVTVGMFARFSGVKDYPVFFKACARIKERVPDFRIVIAGKNFDSHRKALDTMVQDSGLKDITRIVGDVANIEDEILQIDIGVVASNGSEELSRIALEYMACGVPVVATNVGGLPELISDDVGVLVQHSDPDLLAEGIMSLMIDNNKREMFGANARILIEKKHSIELYCNKLAECYLM